MGLATVTVSVPEGRESELVRFAANLLAQELDDGVEWDDADDDEAEPGRAKAGFGRGSVRRAYLGGVSDAWRPFLEYLADYPDEWVAWSELCEAIDRTPREASGMLGAAERRCKQRPPYEKDWEGGERVFRMPASAAEIVRELADERE